MGIEITGECQGCGRTFRRSMPGDLSDVAAGAVQRSDLQCGRPDCGQGRGWVFLAWALILAGLVAGLSLAGCAADHLAASMGVADMAVEVPDLTVAQDLDSPSPDLAAKERPAPMDMAGPDLTGMDLAIPADMDQPQDLAMAPTAPDLNVPDFTIPEDFVFVPRVCDFSTVPCVERDGFGCGDIGAQGGLCL